jgi:ABC-type Fe3+/spermidine/putrescine transport system ATPase subunit
MCPDRNAGADLSATGKYLCCPIIGETNLFSIHSEKGRLLLDNGTVITGVTGSGWKNISIRPEHIRLSAEQQHRPNEFVGVIRKKRYNGASTELLVRVDGLDFKVVWLNSGEQVNSLDVGQQVFLHIAASDLRLFGQESTF